MEHQILSQGNESIQPKSSAIQANVSYLVVLGQKALLKHKASVIV